jgi:hypothetical protein
VRTELLSAGLHDQRCLEGVYSNKHCIRNYCIRSTILEVLSFYLSIWIEAGNSVYETAERTIIVWVDPNVIQHTIRCGHAAVACAPAPAYSGPHCCAAARLCARDDHGDAQRGEFPKGAFGDTGRTLRKRARARRRKLGARRAIAARAYGARHAFKNSQSTEPEGVRRHT